VASIDGVDIASGNLPLYFLLCYIIVLLSWQINYLYCQSLHLASNCNCCCVSLCILVDRWC